MIKIINSYIFCIIISFFSIGNIEAKQSTGNATLKQAAKLLADARDADEQSKLKLLEANSLRKQLIKARAEAKNHTVTGKLSNTSSLLKKLETSQQQGAALRLEADQLKRQAAIDFEQGFVKVWGDWVSNREPLTMDPLVKDYFSHNSQIRSVHKNMLNKNLPNGAEQNSANKKQKMSLNIPSLAKQNAPEELNINAFKFSRKEQYFAHIEVHSESSSGNQSSTTSDTDSGGQNISAVPLNKIHQWRLIVSDLSGKPIENAKIEVEGHMPGHIHGLPTAPQMVGEISPGVYLIDGMKFQMKGWWVMKFIFLSGNEEQKKSPDSDFVIFNLVL